MSRLSAVRIQARNRATIARPLTASGFTILAFAALLAVPALADVLVMQDGSRVSTKGEWQVKGRQVVFTVPNGTLSAVRLSEVDLDASHAATEVANNPPPPAPDEAANEKREPVLVLTNDDIGAGSSDDSGGIDSQADGAGTSTDGQTQQPAAGELVVVEWSYEPAGDDPVYQVTGRLENQTGRSIENIQLYVDIIAVDGSTPRPDVHFLREANVVQSRLEPNESTDFRYGVTIRDLEFSTAPVEQFDSPRVTFDLQYRPSRAPRVPGDGDDYDDDSADDSSDDDIGAGSDEGEGDDARP